MVQGFEVQGIRVFLGVDAVLRMDERRVTPV